VVEATVVESVVDDVSSGYIERDQQGLGNLYRYNDWSSPVGIIGQPHDEAKYILDQNQIQMIPHRDYPCVLGSSFTSFYRINILMNLRCIYIICLEVIF